MSIIYKHKKKPLTNRIQNENIKPTKSMSSCTSDHVLVCQLQESELNPTTPDIGGKVVQMATQARGGATISIQVSLCRVVFSNRRQLERKAWKQFEARA